MDSLQSQAISLYREYSVELVKAFHAYEFDTGLDEFHHRRNAHLMFNVFFSWFIIFLLLYVAFAAIWKFLFVNAGLSDGKKPFIASSRCIGTVHFLFVVPMSMMALNEVGSDWFHVDYLAPTTALEYRVIELSVGYFCADFVHFILFEPDFLMFFHHLFSIGMMGSAGFIGRGGASACGAIVQGEITNPFQSAWTVARTAQAPRLAAFLSPIFTIVFVSVRTTLVPYWSYKIVANYWQGTSRLAMPAFVVEAWSFMATFMVIGGFLWSYSLVKGYFKQKKKAAQKNAKKE